MDQGSIEIYQALNLNRYEFVEVLSRIYWRQNHLDGSKSCWEAIGQIETFSMDRGFVEKLSRKIAESFDGSKMR